MMIRTYFLIYLLAVLQLNPDIVLSQRTFANPAVTDPAPCACDLRAGACDPNCCCDSDCSDADLSVSPICKSIRKDSSSLPTELKLTTWNCSNTTSAALYDYFPFVCVQLTLNEIIGEFESTDSVTFLKSDEDVTDLRSTFVAENPELFQPTKLSSSASTGNYSIGTPIQVSSTTQFTLPGSLVGLFCQENVQVLFGVNRDVTCTSGSLSQNLCTRVNSVTSFLKGGDLSSTVGVRFFRQSYSAPSPSTPVSTAEYYFQNSYSSTISSIASTSGIINDYCTGRHPLTRTQRYSSTCNASDSTLCDNQYQIWSGCPLRDSLQYSTIPNSFFTARSTSADGATNFADFNNPTNVTSISCSNIDVRRVFYRFNYSSTDNTISTVEVFVQTQTSTGTLPNPRFTIEWNDIANNLASSTTIPRGYLNGEVLQFQRNNNVSDVSTLVPTSSGLCVDATRQTLRYKQSTSSSCFIQLYQSTIQQCHDLKLNMYLYLNVFYAPASGVFAYPNSNATLIQIRDNNQDLIDLNRIDETRPDNRLNGSYISQTKLATPTYRIYDTTKYLPVCYNVPSGIYIEFGFVRVHVSPTVSYERIVSVQYNYTYSNWQFDCTGGSCSSTTTQRYLVSFQSIFIDYTNPALNLTDVTRGDLTSADNYIQHLLWLITPEYRGEPGYRKYTIAMILIFIAISVVVMHVLLFGIMCPF